MALLFCAHKAGLQIEVGHITHDMRPQSETDKDLKCVQKACCKFGITFHNAVVSAKNLPGNAEDNYRNLRRMALEKFLIDKENDNHIPYMATAHHADDQLETMIMKLCRGSGLHGLSGIAESRQMFVVDLVRNMIPYTLVRPMLHITKEDAYYICKENDIDYEEDKTNYEDIYGRNRIRHYVLPVLKKFYPKCSEHASECAEIVTDTERVIQRNLEDIEKFERPQKELSLAILTPALFLSEDVIIHAWLRKAVKICAQVESVSMDKFNKKMFDQVIRAIKDTGSSKYSKRFTWPGGIKVSLTMNLVKVYYSKSTVVIPEKLALN